MLWGKTALGGGGEIPGSSGARNEAQARRPVFTGPKGFGWWPLRRGGEGPQKPMAGGFGRILNTTVKKRGFFFAGKHSAVRQGAEASLQLMAASCGVLLMVDLRASSEEWLGRPAYPVLHGGAAQQKCRGTGCGLPSVQHL